MQDRTKWVLGILGVGGTLYSYRSGVDALDFSIDGFQPAPDGINLLMRIKVVNRNTWWGYPVPRMEVNAYDSAGVYIGSMVNDQLQYIPPNRISFLYAIVIPNFTNLVGLITSTISSGHLPSGIEFQGWIKVGPVEIPFNTGFAITGPAYSLNGKNKAVDNFWDGEPIDYFLNERKLKAVIRKREILGNELPGARMIVAYENDIPVQHQIIDKRDAKEIFRQIVPYVQQHDESL